MKYRGNPLLAEFGRKMNFPCGGKLIIGADFAFMVTFAANSYDHFASVVEYGASITPEWHRIRSELCRDISALHTLNDRDSVAYALGLHLSEVLSPFPKCNG